ncbi:MAG: penicillin-binding protein 1C [Verrucomicrobiota bacterium]
MSPRPSRTKLRIALWLLLAAGLLSAIFWLLLPWTSLYPEGFRYSQVVTDRHGELLRVTLGSDDTYRLPIRLAEISPHLLASTFFQEDRHYHRHPGVNPLALLRAAWAKATGQYHSGASTLTMQLARLRYRLETRSLGGKLVQIFRALQLERHYSKDQLLEAYFTLAPYGGNIEGVSAACLFYFGKSPEALSLRESAALTVIPQSPSARRPGSQPNPALQQAQWRLYQRLTQAQGRQPDALAASYAIIPTGPPPFRAPQLVERALAAAPERHRVVTTLDLAQQSQVETTLRQYLSLQRTKGLHNAVACLVHLDDLSIRAYAASADFFNQQIEGQVDGVLARRSPGSTLKPFLFALALEEGLIHPRTLLLDTPQSFRGYNPENFDGGFVGPLAAEEALRRSRNIPAVWLANQLRDRNLYQFLEEADIHFPETAEHYGLALPLGGAEVSMEELLQLYATLANGGQWQPLRFLHSQALAKSPQPLLQAEAAFLTRCLLRDEQTAHPTFWKTGTSHGFRDAWTVGCVGDYALAVWVGNFDGQANPALVAREAALPLFLQIAEGLPSPSNGSRLFQAPPGANLKQVELCAVSGCLPNSHCPHRRPGWFIPGQSPIDPCEVHRQIWIDAESGFRVAGPQKERFTYPEVYEFWPSQLLQLFERAGLPRRLPPALASQASQDGLSPLSRQGRPPRITSPEAGLLYTVRIGQPESALPLEANVEADARQLFWFREKEFIGETPSDEPLFWLPLPGQHLLTAIDDQGRHQSLTVTIESFE